MVTLNTLSQIALALPAVEKASSHDTPGFRVNGKFLAWIRTSEILVIKIDAVQREILLQVEPETFFITDHYKPVSPTGWSYILVRLTLVREGDLRDLLERAWRHEAPKRLVKSVTV